MLPSLLRKLDHDAARVKVKYQEQQINAV